MAYLARHRNTRRSASPRLAHWRTAEGTHTREPSRAHTRQEKTIQTSKTLTYCAAFSKPEGFRWYSTCRLAVVMVAVVRVGESGSSAESLTESAESPSESASAPPPRSLVDEPKHGGGAAGSGDQLPESASSTIGGATQPRL